jgi:hypothetical protein
MYGRGKSSPAIGETGEQSTTGFGYCGGVGGANGRSQGECEPACTHRTQSRGTRGFGAG